MEKSLFLPASLFLLSFDMKILLYTNKIVLTLIILYSVRSFFYKGFISAYVFICAINFRSTVFQLFI